MDKQEEIREGIIKIVRYEWMTDEILSYLHSQGVVIKVKPKPMSPSPFDDATINLVLSQAGYVAVEPLIRGG